uniref:Uncharacterized protein n=1 Tax=Glossina palpalis gambiensis TaxID=67801 RepID=A0A1B0BI55_9MUSC
MAVYLKDPKTNFQLSCVVRWIFHKIIFDDFDDELRKNEQPKAFSYILVVFGSSRRYNRSFGSIPLPLQKLLSIGYFMEPFDGEI